MRSCAGLLLSFVLFAGQAAFADEPAQAPAASAPAAQGEAAPRALDGIGGFLNLFARSANASACAEGEAPRACFARTATIVEGLLARAWLAGSGAASSFRDYEDELGRTQDVVDLYARRSLANGCVSVGRMSELISVGQDLLEGAFESLQPQSVSGVRAQAVLQAMGKLAKTAEPVEEACQGLKQWPRGEVDQKLLPGGQLLVSRARAMFHSLEVEASEVSLAIEAFNAPEAPEAPQASPSDAALAPAVPLN